MYIEKFFRIFYSSLVPSYLPLVMQTIKSCRPNDNVVSTMIDSFWLSADIPPRANTPPVDWFLVWFEFFYYDPEDLGFPSIPC